MKNMIMVGGLYFFMGAACAVGYWAGYYLVEYARDKMAG